MLPATVQNVDRPSTIPDEGRGSGRIKTAPTCAQCFHFLNGICQLKASADWGDRSEVSPARTACTFAELLPF